MIRGYEKGRCAISALHLKHIATAFDISVDALFEESCPGMLLDEHRLTLIESYNTIKRRSHRHALFHLAKGLARQK